MISFIMPLSSRINGLPTGIILPLF